MINTCRICLEDDTPNDTLIRPCTCKDYVHKNCLNEWRYSSKNSINKTYCTVCKNKFDMKMLEDEPKTHQFIPTNQSCIKSTIFHRITVNPIFFLMAIPSRMTTAQVTECLIGGLRNQQQIEL